MTEKKLNEIFEGVAVNILHIKTLEYRHRDGLDFYDNDDGSISVGDLRDALKFAYELGLKEARKGGKN